MTESIAAEVFRTAKGTPYLKSPGVALLAKPSFDPEGTRAFIEGFGNTFNADDYVNDFYEGDYRNPDPGVGLKIEDGTALSKFAGQLCYLSFGEGRTRNDDAQKYMDGSIKAQAHGSVFEHANYSFLFYGIDRAVTHEIVRHRAGFAYSQVSQRYVSGATLRFVERPEYQQDGVMHKAFMERIDFAREQYDEIAEYLRAGVPSQGMSRTEARKAVNQTARSSLPNETEAPIVVTGNVRAWRHFIEMRASKFADTTIRKLAAFTHSILLKTAPLFFNDYKPEDDTLHALTTQYRKV